MQTNLYSIEDLAPILKLHPKTILRFIHEGKIVARKVGRAWMVQEEALKDYLRGGMSETSDKAEAVKRKANYHPLVERITVSAVIEVIEQNSEEATRISNTLLAMLNGRDEAFDKARFDFLYYPEIGKAKYLLYGSPKFISTVLEEFDLLCQQQGASE